MTYGNRGSLYTHLAYSLIICVTVMLALAPEFMRMPIPYGALKITYVEHSLNGKAETISLPHRWPHSTGFSPAHASYRFSIELPTDGRLHYLLIPGAQQPLTAFLNGVAIRGTERQRWGEPAVGLPYAIRLPLTSKAGTSAIEIKLDRNQGGVPGYLSQIYLTDEAGMASVRWVWSLFGANARIGLIGLQVFLVLGIAIIWFARRNDPMVSWLLLLGLTNLAYAAANVTIPFFTTQGAQPFIAFALPAFGLMAFGLSLSIAGHSRPLGLKVAVALIPAGLALLSLTHQLPPRAIVLIGSLTAICASFASAIVLARHSCQTYKLDSALLAVPFFLTGWFGLRDIGIIGGILEGGIILSTHVRPITMTAVLALLMRKLAHSLNEIDRINETLRLKLDEQERQLTALYDKERGRMTQAAREDERQRLMRDLHDGVSGHLVSIIALSERDDRNPKAIERTARAALDDLRLVVNSLDLEDHDILPALAGLRERVEPQLRRLDIELDWSMEKLPQVSGVTPSNALSVLRILQEAITNAVKHGQPRLITVQGMAATDGSAIIEVRNEVLRNSERGKGNGLKNIELRSRKLGGQSTFEIDRNTAVLRLALPMHLAEQ
jgi:two-component system sensor histidine kinase UhpB